MPVFPEQEWMEAVVEQVANHPDAAEQAHKVGGVYRFAMTASGPLTHAYEYHVRIAPDGDGARVDLLDQPADPDLGITADYERWKRLLIGDLDVTKAVLKRQLKVSGGVAAALKRIAAVHLIEYAVENVVTVWPDET